MFDTIPRLSMDLAINDHYVEDIVAVNLVRMASGIG
jgi:hypothetical protein